VSHCFNTRFIGVEEIDYRTKDLGGEESLVLNHIKGSANEGEYNICILSLAVVCNLDISGIWTKHLKAKTELHQTVIDRCLKTLMQKQLIKVVKSVKVRIPLAPF
jgi:DNA-directed RNA polymerase III subunit RPC6